MKSGKNRSNQKPIKKDVSPALCVICGKPFTSDKNTICGSCAQFIRRQPK